MMSIIEHVLVLSANAAGLVPIQTLIMNKLLAERRGSQINQKDMSFAQSDEITFRPHVAQQW